MNMKTITLEIKGRRKDPMQLFLAVLKTHRAPEWMIEVEWREMALVERVETAVDYELDRRTLIVSLLLQYYTPVEDH